MPKIPPAALTPATLVQAAQAPETLMAVVFAHSTSGSYDMAVALARAAARYGEAQAGKKTLHLAVFGRGRDQAAAATALLRLIMAWKGVQVFTSEGVAAHPYALVDVLDCYTRSLAVKDRRAHCVWIYRDALEGATYTVPCQMLRGWFESIADDAADHPSEMPDRIQALAARKGCSWCPNFQAG